MKLFLILFFFLNFWHHSVFCHEKEFYTPNTRQYTLKEAIKIPPADSPVLLKAFEGLSFYKIMEAYQLTDAKVEKTILSGNRAGHFFSRYSLFASYLYQDAGQSPQKAMSYLFPIFIILFLLYFVVFGIKTFLIRPGIGDKIDVDVE